MSEFKLDDSSWGLESSEGMLIQYGGWARLLTEVSISFHIDLSTWSFHVIFSCGWMWTSSQHGGFLKQTYPTPKKGDSSGSCIYFKDPAPENEVLLHSFGWLKVTSLPKFERNGNKLQLKNNLDTYYLCIWLHQVLVMARGIFPVVYVFSSCGMWAPEGEGWVAVSCGLYTVWA